MDESGEIKIQTDQSFEVGNLSQAPSRPRRSFDDKEENPFLKSQSTPALDEKLSEPPPSLHLEEGVLVEPFSNTEIRQFQEHIRSIDWLKRLNPEDKWDRPTLLDAVYIIGLGEQNGTINLQRDEKIIADVISNRLEAEILNNEHLAKEHVRDPQILGRRYQKRADTYKNELKHIQKKPVNAIQWCQKIQKAFEVEKTELVKSVVTTEDRLKKLFPQHIPENLSLDKRIFVMNQVEYNEMAHLQNPNSGDSAVDFAHLTGGFATAMHRKEKRAVVVPLRAQLNFADENDASQGTVLDSKISSSLASNFIQHEIIHIVPDDIEIKTEKQEDGSIIESRGFRSNILLPDGALDKRSSIKRLRDRDIPERGIDEGAVVFLENYVRFNGDFDTMNESISNAIGINKGYQKAALETLEVLRGEKEILNLFARYYFHSDQNGWLKIIRSRMDTFKDAQSEMKLG